jgi:polar amino acid transport system substrate-binding protein
MKKITLTACFTFLFLCVSFILSGILGNTSLRAEELENTLEEVISRGKLIVGCDLTAPPWGTVDSNGDPIGIDPTLAKMLADDLGVRLEIVDTSAPNRITYLVTRKIDIAIAGFCYTPGRGKAVTATDAYTVVDYPLCINKKRAPGVNNVKDLAGHSVAVNKGTIPHIAVMSLAPKRTKIQVYDSASAAALAAITGKVDAFVEGRVICKYYVKKHPDTLKIGDSLGVSTPIQMAVRHTDLIWLNYINSWIDTKYRNGILKEVVEKWLDVPWEAGDPRKY